MRYKINGSGRSKLRLSKLELPTILTLLVIAVGIFALGVYIGFRIQQDSGLVEDTVVSNEPTPVNKQLDTLIILNTPGESLEILVGTESIDFEPFEDVQDIYKSFSVTKTDFPDLFRQGAVNASLIKIDLVSTNSKVLVKISNNQPDHAVFSETYSIVVNPTAGQLDSP